MNISTDRKLLLIECSPSNSGHTVSTFLSFGELFKHTARLQIVRAPKPKETAEFLQGELERLIIQLEHEDYL